MMKMYLVVENAYEGELFTINLVADLPSSSTDGDEETLLDVVDNGPMADSLIVRLFTARRDVFEKLQPGNMITVTLDFDKIVVNAVEAKDGEV